MPKRKCFVPNCNNNSEDQPHKIFVTLPHNNVIRAKWYAAVNINKPLNHNTHIFCCEDHFDLEKDAENWMYYKMMGNKLMMSPDAVPQQNMKERDSKGSQLSESTKRRKQEQMEKLRSSRKVFTYPSTKLQPSTSCEPSFSLVEVIEVLQPSTTCECAFSFEMIEILQPPTTCEPSSSSSSSSFEIFEVLQPPTFCEPSSSFEIFQVLQPPSSCETSTPSVKTIKLPQPSTSSAYTAGSIKVSQPAMAVASLEYQHEPSKSHSAKSQIWSIKSPIIAQNQVHVKEEINIEETEIKKERLDIDDYYLKEDENYTVKTEVYTEDDKVILRNMILDKEKIEEEPHKTEVPVINRCAKHDHSYHLSCDKKVDKSDISTTGKIQHELETFDVVAFNVQKEKLRKLFQMKLENVNTMSEIEALTQIIAPLSQKFATNTRGK